MLTYVVNIVVHHYAVKTTIVVWDHYVGPKQPFLSFNLSSQCSYCATLCCCSIAGRMHSCSGDNNDS